MPDTAGAAGVTVVKAVAAERRPSAARLLGVGLLLGAACLLPFSLSPFLVFQFTQVLVYAMALLGLNMLTGYNGQISLGHGAFFGIPALRLEGLYLALATFALALAVPQILKYFDEWTGGSQGIGLSEPKAPWGLRLNPDQRSEERRVGK